MKNLIFGFVFLSGCASTAWVKEGATQADFANDKQYCALYAHALNDNQTWSRGFSENMKIRECMQERGWHKEKHERETASDPGHDYNNCTDACSNMEKTRADSCYEKCGEKFKD